MPVCFSDTIFGMDFLRKNARFLWIATAAVFVIGFLLLILSNTTSSALSIYIDGQDKPLKITTHSNIPADFFKQAGIVLNAEDRILVNGIPVPAEQPIDKINSSVIQLRKAYQVDLTLDAKTTTFRSSAPSLGQALWEQSIILQIADTISIPLDTPLTADIKVTIRRSQPIRILIQGQEITLPSAAETIGQALAQAGISLQNLDYSIPDENDPIPADRTIKVVHVREEITTQPKPIPFTTEYVADPQLQIDSQKVVQTGEYGLRIAQVRVRYEDGKEVSRKTEAEWVSKAPVTQKYAYGTMVNIQTLSTPDGTIQYYRAISVYITSYRDTGHPTASGKWPARGDVAVRPEWYKYMKGASLYIPGYGIGTVTDVCPGCVGKPWIDVFIPTAEYVGWHTTEMVYFLAPAPANPLWILP
jgi:resuscitation-promoting factor RpfB